MNIPTLIQNSPEAIREYEQIVAHTGLAADPGGYLTALYASIRVDVRHLQDEVAAEGTIITRPSGVRVTNPKVRMLASHRKQALSVARALGLTAKANGGKRPAARQPTLREMLERPATLSAESLI